MLPAVAKEEEERSAQGPLVRAMAERKPLMLAVPRAPRMTRRACDDDGDGN